MTRFLRFLRSTELALVAMGALAALVGVGTVIPQRLKTDPSDYAIWKAHLPWLMGPAETLGLTDLYRSPVFLGLAAVFALNLAFCTWRQVGTAARRMRPHEAVRTARPSGVDGAGEGTAEGRALFVPSSGDHLHTGGRVVRFFESAGYSMRSLGPGRWEGRRRWWGHLSLVVFHASLLLVIVGALAVNVFSFRGILELAEGQGFVAGTDAFLQSSRGALGREPAEGLAIRLDSFRAAYYPNGQIEVRESDLSIRLDGDEESSVVSSSHPVTVGDFRVYQSTRFGWSPLLRLAFPDGREQEGLVNLAEYGEAEVATGARLYRQEITPPGTSASLSITYEAPMNTSVDPPGRGEATLTAEVRDGGERLYAGPLAPGESLDLPGGVKLTYVDLRRWSGLVVVGTPGLWSVYLGAALSLLTLLLHFTVVPERIRVSATADEGGAPGYRLVGWRRRFGGTFSERLADLAARLETALCEE